MTNHHFHAAIWIDHHEARVFHFSSTDVERLVLHPDHRPSTSTIRQTRSGAGMPPRITLFFRQSRNRLQTPVQFSLRDQPMRKLSSSSTSAVMIPP